MVWGIGDLKYTGEKRLQMLRLLLIGSKCIEYKKNSSFFSGKLTGSKIVRRSR